MGKHTPGPWECGKDAGVWANELKICTMSWFQDPKNPIHICHVKTQANARLIAAAPELLEALKGAIFYVEKVAITPGDLNDLRLMKQAITKAEA